jgi:hypothetical protein
MARSATAPTAAKAIPGRLPQRGAPRGDRAERVNPADSRPAHSVSPYLLDDITLTREELLAARGYRKGASSEKRAA